MLRKAISPLTFLPLVVWFAVWRATIERDSHIDGFKSFRCGLSVRPFRGRSPLLYAVATI